MKEIQTIGVVGAGAMGRGIAQIAAQAGLRVRLYDTSAEAVASAREALRQTWDKLAQKGKLGAAGAQAALERVVAAGALSDMADCQLVVEAIVERLDVKRDLFAALEGVVAGTASWLRTRPRCPSPPSLRPASARSAWPAITSSTRWR